MTSEIRTNSLKSRSGMSTVTMTDTGPMFSGITTFVDNSGFTFGVGGGTSIFTPATNVLTFGTNNTEKIRIDASGHMHGVGVITATHFYGDGSNLTGISADVVDDTSPQLGGDLASNSHDILFADNDKAIFGTGSDFKIYHNGTHNYLMASNGDYVFDTGSAERLRINSNGHLSVGGSNVTDVNLLTLNGSGAAQNVGIVFNKTNSPARVVDPSIASL